MNNTILNQSIVYPVSQAREVFGALVDQVEKDKTILVTKQGRIKAALVDFKYFQQMQKDLEVLYKKTYINKKLLPYTRTFSDKEIQEWLEEDKL